LLFANKHKDHIQRKKLSKKKFGSFSW